MSALPQFKHTNMPNVSDMDVLSPLGISVSRLAIGDVYFLVSYLDEAKRLPVIESLIYIGNDLGGEIDGSLYFQDVESYHERSTSSQNLVVLPERRRILRRWTPVPFGPAVEFELEICRTTRADWY
jgi:hypothetical protein